MKNRKRTHVKKIFLSLLLLGSLVYLAGCEDALTPVIEEEVRLAALPGYTLTILDPAVGSVTPSGDQKLKDGEGLAVSASAPGGYTFVNWEQISGSGTVFFDDENAASTIVQLSGGSATIQPVISNTLYDLVVGNDGNGTTDPSGTISVANNVARSISATADSAAGYEFDTWELVSGAAVFGDASQAATTVTVSGGNAEIKANFKLKTFTLTILDPSAGLVTPSGAQVVNSGEGLPIIATVPGSYTFVNWEKISGSGTVLFNDENAASTVVRLTGGSATIQPIITNTLRDLTVGNDGNGTTDPSGTVSVADSVARSISATPNSAAGYEFDTWELVSGSAVFGDASQAATTVTVSGGNAGIRANFKLKTYSVTLTNDGHGSTSPSDTISVTHGQPSSTVSATPAYGYQFKNWSTISGPAVTFNSGATSNSTTITATGASTIRANFELKSYSLSAIVSGSGNSIINPASFPVSVTHGVARSIYAGAPSQGGYYFSGWTKSGGSGSVGFGDPSARSTTVTVTGGSATIAANYDPITASLSYRGTLDLYNGSPYTAQRFTVVNDLTYDSGYIYIAGSTPGFGSDYAKVMKIDVSNVSSPSFDSSVNIALNSDANELAIDGSYLYVAVSGTNGDRYRSTLTTGSGLNSFSDLGHNTPVLHVTGGHWIADSTEISRWQVPGTYDVGSDDPIEDILYIPEYNYLYVTRAAGMGSNGYAETYYQSGSSILNEGSDSVTNKTPGKMVYNAPENIYAVSGDGLITFYVDWEDFYDVNTVSPTSNTGSSLVDADINDTGNYLVTAGDSGTDRLAVFDVHGSNGSVSAPYYISSRTISKTAEEVIAVEVAGNYVYTLEGTNLVIYELITNTD